MDEATLVARVTKAIAEFEIYARHGMLNGMIRVADLHRIYQRIQPVLHPTAANSKAIDLGALGYALSRLPANICRVNRIRLKKSVPADFHNWPGVTPVETEVLGRPTFDIGDGELVMLVQEDIGDVLDILSLLCCLTVECRKIRQRLVNSGLDDVLSDYSSTAVAGGTFGLTIHRPTITAARKNQLFSSLAFELGTDEDEIFRLDRGWNGTLVEKMNDIARWDEDVVVQFHTSISRTSYAHRIVEWARDLKRTLSSLDLGDRPLHVISADPFSVADSLLSSRRVEEVQKILDDMSRSQREKLTADLEFREGKLEEPYRSYGLAQLLRSHGTTIPSDESDFPGIWAAEDRHHIGLNCKIIDPLKLDADLLDPRLNVDSKALRDKKPVILAFNRVFGSQGGKIIQALTKVFPKRLHSYNLVFLAGALVGRTGSILSPTYVIRDGTWDVVDFLVPNSFDPAKLGRLIDNPVDAGGPIVTVLGIVLQSRGQLRHYKEVWKAIGVDLYGAPLANAMNHALLNDAIRSDMKFRIAYVATDNPLNEEETLSHNTYYMGIKPHSAIALSYLQAIFDYR